MAMTTEAGEKSPLFFPVDHDINTKLVVPLDFVESNIRQNIVRNIPKIHQRPDWGVRKNRPLALVAGGPSLKTTLDELRGFQDIMVCGTPHDFLIQNGFKPTYAVSCEAVNWDGGVMKFITMPQNDCEYLISTSCEPSVFDALSGYHVTMWNNYGGVEDAVFEGEPAIQGGCTVTLRALNIAILLGYYDLHFFGFDSSFEDENQNHAYDAGHLSNEAVIRVRVGGPDGREFKTNLAWLAQAQHFQEQLNKTGWMFNPVVHGDGVIAEIMRHRRMT